MGGCVLLLADSHLYVPEPSLPTAKTTSGDKPAVAIGDACDVSIECAVRYGCPAFAVCGIRHFAAMRKRMRKQMIINVKKGCHLHIYLLYY